MGLEWGERGREAVWAGRLGSQRGGGVLRGLQGAGSGRSAAGRY